MRRTKKKHARAIETHRRNKGPELLSLAADNELQKKADKLAEGLATATIDHGSAAAASLLVDLAETATYHDNPSVIEHAFSIIDKWEKEPQIIVLDTSPQIAAPPTLLQLTDGENEQTDTSGADHLEMECDAERD